MAVIVKRATLWTIDCPNTPGTLAKTLGPLADQGVNLDVVMGYSYPDKTHATIEVYPIDSAQSKKAARTAGFHRSELPCVSVIGPNRAGLGRQIAAALSDAGININFFIAQVVGKQYAGLFGFEANSEADLAAKIIRTAANGKPVRPAGSKTAARSAKSGRWA